MVFGPSGRARIGGGVPTGARQEMPLALLFTVAEIPERSFGSFLYYDKWSENHQWNALDKQKKSTRRNKNKLPNTRDMTKRKQWNTPPSHGRLGSRIDWWKSKKERGEMNRLPWNLPALTVSGGQYVYISIKITEFWWNPTICPVSLEFQIREGVSKLKGRVTSPGKKANT